MAPLSAGALSAMSSVNLVVWFAQLPPMANTHGKYLAQVFTIIVRGTD
jgi:hypothetical protein